MAEIKYEIKETVATISENNKGWSKELNLISWNDRGLNTTSGIGRQNMRRWAKV